MSGYIYIPIPTDQLIMVAEMWRESQIRGSKQQPYSLLYHSTMKGRVKGFVRYLGWGVLRTVTVYDKVYVLCHADGDDKSGARTLGARYVKDGPSKTYSHEDLAITLQKEGLPLDFHDLRVYACGSGNIPAQVGFTKSYAANLYDAMKQAGYKNIKVTGYRGKLYFSSRTTFFGKTFKRGVTIDNEVFPASTNKVVFPSGI